MRWKRRTHCGWITRVMRNGDDRDDEGGSSVGPRIWSGLRCVTLSLILGMSMHMNANAALSVDKGFDHFSTGFPLTGAHARVDCEGCHVGGVFRNTPAQCDKCHTRGGRVAASFKPIDHIPSTNNCDDCHITSTWRLVRRVDHIAVIGTCARCHDGRTAPGKPPGHIQSDNNCEQCHTTAAWSRIQFDHSGVAPGTCISCHNGVKATGKSSRHILSTDACDDCHSTVRWSPARVDHTAVVGTCYSCHNGQIARGKSVDHPPTSNNCNECHTTSTWAGAD
jgi:hypothetical protein